VVVCGRKPLWQLALPLNRLKGNPGLSLFTRPCLSPPDPPESAGRPIANQKSLNVLGKFDF
jgi:hypothetical protein